MGLWTWTAIDAESKLIVGYRVGQRTVNDAHEFMNDVAARLANRVQLTTDSLRVYLNAVDEAFGMDIDYATLEKRYGSPYMPSQIAQYRYSPAKITSMKAATITGDPKRRYVSTSYVERQNLTMRRAASRG